MILKRFKMKSVSNWILNLSSEKVAKLLVVYPIGIILVLTSLSLLIRARILQDNFLLEFIIIKALFLVLFSMIFFWALWIWATVISSEEEIIGLNLKWFKSSFYFFIAFIIWQIIRVFLFENIDTAPNKKSDITPIINETLSMIVGLGLFIGYPVICHYAARALLSKKTKDKITFTKALGYSLLLIFIPISIPFLHLYIHEGRSKTSSIIKLYGIAVFLLFVMFCIALVTAFTGKV